MKNQLSRIRVKALLALVFTVFAFSFKIQAQDGAKLFKQNCAVCHASHTDQKLTGPGLKGVFDRAPKGDWLTKWILNSEKMIKSGDAYANKIYNENGKAAMTVFEGQLNEKDVASILAFIQGTPPADGAPKSTVVTADGGKAEVSAGIDPLYMILGVIVILAIMLVALRSIRTSIQNTTNLKEGKEENPDITFWQEVKDWMSGHRRLVGVLSIIIVFVGMKGFRKHLIIEIIIEIYKRH